MLDKEITTIGAGTFSFAVKLGPSTYPSHINIAYSAKAYFIAGTRCLENRPIPGGTQVCIGPGIVCHCFSIELLLKVLLTSEGKTFKKIHGIADLLSEVDKGARKEFCTKYEEIIPNPGFDAIVNASNNLFIKVRYEHEIDYLEFPESEIQLLNKVIYEYCEQLWSLK
jgi:HEPN domain